MKKKTIVFVQNIEFPQQGAVDIFYYSKFLSKYEDINIKVIVSKINENIKNKNLEIIEIGKINYFSFILKAFSKIKKINKNSEIDYVYFFAQNPFSVLLQFLVKYFLKIKTIYDVVSGPIGKGIFSIFSRYTIKFGVFLSDKYIVLDKYLIDKLSLPKTKIHKIIGMGYDKEIFKENKRIDLFKRKKLEIIFTYIGTLNKERNLDIFIKAFIENLKEYKNLRLYFIGSGNGENNLKDISINYLGKNIFFLGNIAHKKIPDYINSSDILVSYVPKIEYFEYQIPTKLIEYLGCNKTIIATNTVSQKEVLFGFDDFLHNDDLKNTKNKIQYFVKNFEDIKNNNFENLVKKYEWGKLVKNIKELI